MVWSNLETTGLQTAGAKKILLLPLLMDGQRYLATGDLPSLAKNGMVPPKVLLKIYIKNNTVRET